MQQQALLASLFSKLHYAILLADSQDNIVFVNDDFVGLFSLPSPPQAYTGKHINTLQQHTCSGAVFICKNAASDTSEELNVKDLIEYDQKLLEREVIRNFEIPGSDQAGTAWLFRSAPSEMVSQQENFYKSVLDTIPSEIVVFDSELRYKYVNPSAVTEKEVREWMLAKSHREYAAFRNLPEEMVRERSLHLKRAIDERAMVKLEETTQDPKTGEQLHFIREICPVMDEQGQVKLLVTCGQDITPLRHAQEVAIASEASNKAILQAIPDLVFVLDREGTYIAVNNSRHIQLDTSASALIGSNIRNSVPPHLAGKFLKLFSQVLDNGQPGVLEYDFHDVKGRHYCESRIVKYQEDQVLMIIRDITELHENEQLLKEKDELLRQIMETSNNLIFVKDVQGTFTYANQTFAEYLGCPVKEIIGKTDAELVDRPEETALIQEMDQMVIQTMRTYSFEEQLTRRDGETVWLRTVKKPLVVRTGEVHVMGIATNITEEKQAKEQLQKSEELYRLLSDNSKDVICLHEIDGTIIFISKSVEDLYGYTQEEIVGTSPFDIMHPDDVVMAYENGLNEVKEHRSNVIVDMRQQKKNGDYIWVEAIIKPILNSDGQVYKIQTSTRDITERKRAGEALRNSEKKYRELIKHSQAYILTHDLEGHILSVNPYLLDQLGFAEEEVVGRRFQLFFSFTGAVCFKDYILEFDQDAATEGIITTIDKDSERRYLYCQSYKVQEQGEAPYIIAIAQDITERILIEEELKKARDVAEDSARVKENFLANMSHEIRTPMNGIMGMAGLLEKTALNPAQKKYLDIIRRSSENLLVVINDILDFSKLEAGKINMEQIPFNLAETVTVAYESLRYKAEEKELNYTLKPVPIGDTTLLGDPYRLNQVLLNLLNNAIKFTEEGSVTLTVELVEETDEFVQLEFIVQDTGIGVPEDKQESIFEGFTQAYSSTSRKFGGTGLGLNICKSLIELQGGRIWVESKGTAGSTFKFTVSYKKTKEQINPETGMEIDYNQLNKVHLLLAEDNEVNIFLAQSIIEGWGATVDVAVNGWIAVEKASQNTYDVILMDIQMPELNGMDATHQIRQLPDQKKANVPIIALTANVIKGDAEKYVASGMNDYISKPFDEEELFLKIYGVLPRHEAEELAEQPAPVAAQKESEAGVLLYNLSMLHKMARGNENIIIKTKQIFVDTVLKSVQELEQKYNVADWPGVRATAHKLKPTFDLMGIEKLYKAIREIEQKAGQEADLSEIGNHVKLVVAVSEQVVEQILEERQV